MLNCAILDGKWQLTRGILSICEQDFMLPDFLFSLISNVSLLFSLLWGVKNAPNLVR